MDLSIIVVSFNTKDLLKKCLDSLPLQAEVIVVDNASNDGTVEMLKKLSRKAGSGSARKIIENKENIGFARAVNQGLKQAKGEYLLLLNSDIFVKKNALDKLIAFAKDQHQAGVIGGRLLNPDSSIQGSCFNLPTLSRVIKEFWFKGLSVLSKYAPFGDKPVEVEAVIGAVFLIPRKIIDKVGFFDERYFMYFEDLDYCRRVGQAGYKVYYLPEAEFIHAHGASGKNISSQTHKWLVESSQIYYGRLKYKLISLIVKTGQKWQKFGRK